MNVSINVPEENDAERITAVLSDLGIDCESVVSRHRKYTVEFERTLSICVERYKNLISKTNRKERVVRFVNSICNELTVARLEELKKNYVKCAYCPKVTHCRVTGHMDSPEPLTDEDNESRGSSPRRKSEDRKKAMKNLVHERHRLRSTLPNIFVLSTRNMLQRIKEKKQEKMVELKDEKYYELESGMSVPNYIICLAKEKQDEIPLFTALYDAVKYFKANILPLFKILSVSIIITILQWILFIIRVVYSKSHTYTAPGEESIMFGAFSGRLLKEDLAIYRIFTSSFMHNSGAHLIIGTIMHFRFSSVFERIHGAVATLVIYFLTSAYGMVGISCYAIDDLQANGFAGDWGMAGALLSRYFIFPYLIDREHHHISNIFVSLICLLFAKTITAESSILVSTHLLSGLAGFFLGVMINNRLRKKVWWRFANILVDLVCSLTLLSVPIGSIFMLFLISPTTEGGNAGGAHVG